MAINIITVLIWWILIYHCRWSSNLIWSTRATESHEKLRVGWHQREVSYDPINTLIKSLWLLLEEWTTKKVQCIWLSRCWSTRVQAKWASQRQNLAQVCSWRLGPSWLFPHGQYYFYSKVPYRLSGLRPRLNKKASLKVTRGQRWWFLELE